MHSNNVQHTVDDGTETVGVLLTDFSHFQFFVIIACVLSICGV